jgi:hypothetical protein
VCNRALTTVAPFFVYPAFLILPFSHSSFFSNTKLSLPNFAPPPLDLTLKYPLVSYLYKSIIQGILPFYFLKCTVDLP